MRTTKTLIAVALTALVAGCGGGAQFDSIEQNWTIPDSWTCATTVYEAGGPRTLGNNSYRLEVGTQALGQMTMYHPVDAAFDSIATVKGTQLSYNWTSTTPIRAVIVSAGAGKTTVFDYRPGKTSGKGLVANDNVNSLEPTSLLFCFDAPPPICG